MLIDDAGGPDVIELLPSRGVPPLLFGMTPAEVLEGTRHLGMQSEVPPGSSSPTQRTLRVRTEDLRLDIFSHFDDGEHLTSVELWRPKGDSPRVVLRLDREDIDIFGPPADSVMEALRRRGYEVDTSDPYFPACVDISLGFNRDGGEGNYDEDLDSGLGIRFNSVVLAPPGYGG